MTRLCYLASPIDFAGESRPMTRIAEFSLAKAGFVVFTAAHAFTMPESCDPDPRVRKVNHRALTQADCMLAILPDDVRTVGVPMEIEQAVAQCGIPTAVWGGEGSWALQRPGLVTVEHLEHAIAWLDVNTPAERTGWERRRQPFYVKTEAEDLLPTRKYDGDAGFDLYVAAEQTVLMPQSFTDVSAGIKVEMPEHLWGLIVGRSSTVRARGLQVQTGIIDGGWRGDLFAGVWNMSNKPVTVYRGERIAQFIPLSNAARMLEVVATNHLSESDRGERGFGSSGK